MLNRATPNRAMLSRAMLSRAMLSRGTTVPRRHHSLPPVVEPERDRKRRRQHRRLRRRLMSTSSAALRASHLTKLRFGCTPLRRENADGVHHFFPLCIIAGFFCLTLRSTYPTFNSHPEKRDPAKFEGTGCTLSFQGFPPN